MSIRRKLRVGQPARAIYAQALRHSRRVRFLRRAIPIGAGLSVALLVAVTWLNPFARYGGLSLGPISVLGHPRGDGCAGVCGVSRMKRGPYEVTADEALAGYP